MIESSNGAGNVIRCHAWFYRINHRVEWLIRRKERLMDSRPARTVHHANDMNEYTTRTRLYSTGAGLHRLIMDDPDTLAIRRSLRLRRDDVVCCFNGDGIEYVYRIVESARNVIMMEMIESRPNPLDHFPETMVLIAATKGKTKDRIVRDLTPLAVTRIVVYRADRSICKPQDDSVGRLRKIAIESCRQCGRSTVPEIEMRDRSLVELYDDREFSSCQSVLFWEKASGSDPWSTCDPSRAMSILFGPEGGFSPDEITFIEAKGIPVASLGKRILRTELAAVVGVTIAQSKRGVMNGT